MDTPNGPDYEQIRRGLLRAMASVCPPWLAADREDLVQRALMRLMRLERQGAGGEWSAAYLRKTAYCQVVDEIRRRRRAQESPLETEAGPLPIAGGLDPERQALGRELGQATRSCLEGLLPPRRRALTLRLLGYPNREIAVQLGWSAKRAENLVTRGKQDLRQCLESKGVEP